MGGRVERDVGCGCRMSLDMSCVEWFGWVRYFIIHNRMQTVKITDSSCFMNFPSSSSPTQGIVSKTLFSLNTVRCGSQGWAKCVWDYTCRQNFQTNFLKKCTVEKMHTFPAKIYNFCRVGLTPPLGPFFRSPRFRFLRSLCSSPVGPYKCQHCGHTIK
jgi:hypothetical protein